MEDKKLQDLLTSLQLLLEEKKLWRKSGGYPGVGRYSQGYDEGMAAMIFELEFLLKEHLEENKSDAP